MLIVGALIYVFGVRRQDPARKRKVSIFLYCAVSYFLIGIYVSDKTRNCCELGNMMHMQRCCFPY